MLFLFIPRYPRWFGLYKKSKMVDLQLNLEAWLLEASLFRNEPIDNSQNFDFDDLLSDEKANVEGSPAAQVLPDLGWLDENVDLSALGNPYSLLGHPNETETLMEDDAAFLLGFLDSGFDPSCLPSDAFKDQEIELAKCLESDNLIPEATSFEVLDFSLESPCSSSLQATSPSCNQLQSPASPFSDISDVPEVSSYDFILPTSETSNASGLPSCSSESSAVHVAVYDDISSPISDASSEEVLSIEEVSNSMRKRKFVSNGKDVPKVKVILKEYAESAPRVKRSNVKERRERKKAQNKEAAARYRFKKRIEEQELSGVVENLESQQNDLKQKHDELKSEIKYLKSLMCEILQKKGIMK